MALSSLRLRRTLPLSSSLIRNLSSFSTASSPYFLQSHTSPSPSILPPNPRNVPSQWFRSTSLASYSSRSSFRNDDEKISPDTILFEGCDYNHWLITIDFRDLEGFKDTKPTPDQMVEHYVQTAAKVFGSVEEAKKRIYACSTTTYNGFQVLCSEDTSNKFEGLPGVVFILPDSYIDPVNKEYGGDKYMEGTIIPRPPPVQQGRNRYNDGNRNYGRPRYDRQRDPMPTQQAGQINPPPQNYTQQQNYPPRQTYSPQGPQQNYPPQGPQQNYPPQGPPQNYSPQGPPQNYPPHGPPQGPQPSYSPQGPQPIYSPQGPQQNYPPRPNYGPSGQGHMPMGNRDYAPGGRDQQNYAPDNRDSRGDNRNFGPSTGGEFREGAGSSYGQSHSVEQRDGMQGEQRDYKPMGQDGQAHF